MLSQVNMESKTQSWVSVVTGISEHHRFQKRNVQDYADGEFSSGPPLKIDSFFRLAVF